MAQKNNYDSDFCGSLPLNHINVIQSYGYLLVLEKEDFQILQVSENVSELLKRPLKDIISTPLEKFTAVEQLRGLNKRFGSQYKEKFPLGITIDNQKMAALAHFKPGYIILEIEKPGLHSERPFTQVYEEVKYAMAAIEAGNTIEEVSQSAIRELRKITGFDGIMMYRFDEEWNGTVIAEDKTDEGLEHYLGHTFPGSDVPRQARELYLKNPYRLIPDREYEPIRLQPVVNPVTNAFIDLSDCNLRGVAAVHLEYLKNMNVKSSMSIRVIVDEQLWGLIACHHIAPHYLNFETCSVCEMLSAVISSRISGMIHKENFNTESELQRIETELIARVYAAGNLTEGLLSQHGASLGGLLDGTGVAANVNGKYHVTGKVPGRDTVENLFLWLQNKQADKVFHTDSLPALFDEASAFAEIASGMLAIPVNLDKGEFIVVFRPELVQTINWGGDPNKTINIDPDGKKYHPRASFKIWQQKVHNTSVPWTKSEVSAAEHLRAFIYEFINKQNKV